MFKTRSAQAALQTAAWLYSQMHNCDCCRYITSDESPRKRLHMRASLPHPIKQTLQLVTGGTALAMQSMHALHNVLLLLLLNTFQLWQKSLQPLQLSHNNTDVVLQVLQVILLMVPVHAEPSHQCCGEGHHIGPAEGGAKDKSSSSSLHVSLAGSLPK